MFGPPYQPSETTSSVTTTLTNSNFEHFMRNKRVYRNTLILCVTWSVSSYSFYFVEFYLRLVPTSTIYIQKILMGCADIIATIVYFLLVTKIGVIHSYRILYSLLALSSLILTITLLVITE